MENPTPYVIKRYGNRKLYDTVQSRYVTLNEIYSYVENNQPVQVINNTTQEDITSATLLNALAEVGKGRPAAELVPLLSSLATYLNGGN